MSLTVAQAAMPPVEVVIEKYTDSHYLIRANGKILVHGIEDPRGVRHFYQAVLLGIEAAGRRAKLTGVELL
jgi:hypothetical protein